jgi:Glycosyl hydrolases family 43
MRHIRSGHGDRPARRRLPAVAAGLATVAAVFSGVLLWTGSAQASTGGPVTAPVATTAAPAATPAVAPLAPHAAAGTFSFPLPPTPAYGGDAGDPDVVESGGIYYAFSTGTPLGNHLQALVNTSGSPTSGWQSYTGQSFGSSALPAEPGWEADNTQTSPGVFFFANHWVMFYDAAQAGHGSDTGFDCLSVATAGSLSPTNAAFTDTSAGPLVCQSNLGGAIDPSPFIDPVNNTPWLVWKSNDGGSSQPAGIWTEELNSSGTGFLAGSSPTEIFFNNTAAFPWESTVEDPSMLYTGGQFYLLFSGGIYTSPSYAEGVAACATPTSTCTQTDPNPILSSYGDVAGPGGGSWFVDSAGREWLIFDGWTSGCTNYSCGGARRLFATEVTPPGSTATSGLNEPVVGSARSPDSKGYWLVASDGGIFSFGDAKFFGSTGAIHLNRPIVGMARTMDGKGYWLVASDGGIFSFGDAGFYGSEGGHHLNQPIVGMAATPDGRGYWLVASDGGIFSFGDARFFGSTGAIHLNQPIVGMAATPDGKGYWLVASDGGIFTFGDATFHGSTGAMRLNQPIVGMAASPTGNGYWLVASDGGIFTFGDATYHGSTGAIHLNQPIVAMSNTLNGAGYWLFASDGGVFTYGNAFFFGSPA